MDSEQLNPISMMSESDQKELQTFIQKSQGQLSVNELVSQLTQTCFKKCVQNPIVPGKLNSTEQSCAANCVARWFDSQNAVIKAVGSQSREHI